MNKAHSHYLKAITGVVLITKDGEDKLYCLDDMQYSKQFSIGQIFNAVRVLYGKDVSEYGKKWPHFRDDENNISNDWKALLSILENCDSDYDFLVETCNQLGEEVPAIVDRETTNKRFELFKATIMQIAELNN